LRLARKIVIYTVLIVAALSFIYPFFWMIMASLSPEQDIGGLVFLPSEITLDNYQAMIGKIPIGRALFNSIFVSAINTGVSLVFCSMVGYALSRMEFKMRNAIFFIIIFTMSLPFQITLIPNYITMVKLHWIDTYLSLTVPFMINAFAILMFRQAFKSLPQALSPYRRLWRIAHHFHNIMAEHKTDHNYRSHSGLYGLVE